MFCRELFGKKPQKLEFGLQPHKIPDCDVVSAAFILTPEPPQPPHWLTNRLTLMLSTQSGSEQFWITVIICVTTEAAHALKSSKYFIWGSKNRNSSKDWTNNPMWRSCPLLRLCIWCLHPALAVLSSLVLRTKCTSTSNWGSSGISWRVSDKPQRWRRWRTPLTCSWPKVSHPPCVLFSQTATLSHSEMKSFTPSCARG